MTFAWGTDSFLKEAGWSLKGNPTALAHLDAGNKRGRIGISIASFLLSFLGLEFPRWHCTFCLSKTFKSQLCFQSSQEQVVSVFPHPSFSGLSRETGRQYTDLPPSQENTVKATDTHTSWSTITVPETRECLFNSSSSTSHLPRLWACKTNAQSPRLPPAQRFKFIWANHQGGRTVVDNPAPNPSD